MSQGRHPKSVKRPKNSIHCYHRKNSKYERRNQLQVFHLIIRKSDLISDKSRLNKRVPDPGRQPFKKLSVIFRGNIMLLIVVKIDMTTGGSLLH